MVTNNVQNNSSSYNTNTCSLNNTSDGQSTKSCDYSSTTCLTTLSNVNLDQIGSSNTVNCDIHEDFIIYHQNIRGLSNKYNEMLNLWFLPLPQILCFTEHHLKNNEICNIPINSYKLGSYHCRELCKGGGVCIYVHESMYFTTINLSRFCKDTEIEICAIKLYQFSTNMCVLSIYRSPSGNFSKFLDSLDSVPNFLFSNSKNLIMCGDFNVNFSNNSNSNVQLSSLLASYNLQGIIDFPTRICETSHSIIDNMFINKSINNKFTPGLITMDCLTMTHRFLF
jgi:exonuclease III